MGKIDNSKAFSNFVVLAMAMKKNMSEISRQMVFDVRSVFEPFYTTSPKAFGLTDDWVDLICKAGGTTKKETDPVF